MGHDRAPIADGLISGGLGIWVLFAVSMSVVLARRQQVKELRELSGCCLKCGYDLRASTGRCPECGEPVPGWSTELPTTPAVDRILAQARAIADDADADHVGSEHVLLALVKKGVPRDQAYRWIQRHALAGGDLQALLRDDADVRRHLDAQEIASLFDITHTLRHIDALFARALEDG